MMFRFKLSVSSSGKPYYKGHHTSACIPHIPQGTTHSCEIHPSRLLVVVVVVVVAAVVVVVVVVVVSSSSLVLSLLCLVLSLVVVVVVV